MESTLERLSGLFGSFSVLQQKEEPKGILYRILLFGVRVLVDWLCRLTISEHRFSLVLQALGIFRFHVYVNMYISIGVQLYMLFCLGHSPTDSENSIAGTLRRQSSGVDIKSKY